MGISDPNAGAFIVNPTLDFFTQEQRTSPVYENPPRALSWTPADLSPVSTFFSPSRPIDIPAPATSRQRGERKRRTGGFFREHIRLTFPRQSPPSEREDAVVFSPSSPPPEPQAGVVSDGDASGLSTAWTRRGRFGGRLTTRTRKNWLLFSPGKLFGNTVTSS